jgi:hypothetical protein
LDSQVSAPASPRESLILGVASILLELISTAIAAVSVNLQGGAFPGEFSSLFILLFAYSGIISGAIPATIGIIFGSLAFRRNCTRYAFVAIMLNVVPLLVSLGFLTLLILEKSTSE